MHIQFEFCGFDDIEIEFGGGRADTGTDSVAPGRQRPDGSSTWAGHLQEIHDGLDCYASVEVGVDD